MNIDLKKTTAQIDRCLPDSGEADLERLHRMYELTLRLQSQLLAVIYDRETFQASMPQVSLAREYSRGVNDGASVTLTVYEPLPSMKKLTEAIEEHWKAALHAAIGETARQGPLPRFEKAFVEIEIITLKGSNNARLWDTSNRAVNVIINNLKGIFFEDDNMEHMAFSVVGRWGEKGVTIIRISELDKSHQIETGYF